MLPVGSEMLGGCCSAGRQRSCPAAALPSGNGTRPPGMGDGATALCQGSELPQTTQEPTLEARQAQAFWLSPWDIFPADRDVSAGAEEVTVRGGAPSLTVPKSDGTGPAGTGPGRGMKQLWGWKTTDK